jgi:hypothetical protein
MTNKLPPNVATQTPAVTPLEAVTREELHARSIDMRGFRRSDGLFEVQAKLLDSKPLDFRPPSGIRVVAAGDPIHQMDVRIVFDAAMTVRDVTATVNAAPYADCAGGPTTLKTLIGLTLGRGWTREVQLRLGGAASCSHLMGLMAPMAAAAIQTMAGVRLQGSLPVDGAGRPFSIGTCLAYAEAGQIVRQQWPRFFRPSPK